MSHKFSKSIPAHMARDEFVEVFGPVYEHSPWIAQQAWDVGLNETHNAAEALHKVLAAIVDASGNEAQLALLRAHPDLAGKLAVQGDLTV